MNSIAHDESFKAARLILGIIDLVIEPEEYATIFALVYHEVKNAIGKFEKKAIHRLRRLTPGDN